MPSLDTDCHPNGIDGRGSTPKPIDRLPADNEKFEDDIPQLSSNVYNPAVPPRRPIISTNLPAPTSYANHVPPQDDRSPDPHEFYRVDQGHGQENPMREAGSSRKHSGGSLRSHRSRPGSPRSKVDTASSHPPIASRIKNARYALASEQDRSPSNSSKTGTTYPSAPRNRQTSLQELVNKFNQNSDQVPPVPNKSSSRSPSTSSSIRAPISRSGTTPLTRTPSQGYSGSFSSDAPGSNYSRTSNQRRGRAHGDGAGSPRFKKNYTMEPSKTVPAKLLTSQSLVDLAPDIGSLPRKPLFGELFSPTSSASQAGYGIPAPKRRRGSDGSLHSPNPLYADTNYLRHRDHSPSSPAAWYYGNAPPLDEIKAKGGIPEPPPNLHRRTRSESHGQNTNPTYSQKSYTNHLSPPSSPIPTDSSRRSSQSRIPLSTRRISLTSDSGDYSSTTYDHSPPNTRSAKHTFSNRAPPPKPLQTAQRSPRYSRSNTPQKSPRYQGNTGRPVTSPRLAAYISEPLPKKSPPLRSSRPRQPVSSASTSASRARAVEKFTPGNESHQKHREQRHRKPPELGAVDFAARRQKIQQAFTKTVKEEEEREIRRMSMAQPASRGEGGDVYKEELSRHDLSQGQHPDESAEEGQALIENGGRKDSVDKDLTIDTGQMPDRSMLDLDDSPTLGSFNSAFVPDVNQHQRDISSPNSDIDPGSALTAGTSDSVDTFFDDEPQDGSFDSSRRPSTAQPIHPSYAINATSSRTPSPPGLSRGDGANDIGPIDDRESIQIMLGSTPILEQQSFQAKFAERPEARSRDDPDSRWSMSTWTSSVRSGDERDSQLERIEESYPATNDPEYPSRSPITVQDSTHQTWTPNSTESPGTDRTTMDSDRYSTINRVLDQYHDLNTPNRDALQEILQQTYKQSPDLMRQGGYDPRKVTQLYLQRMAQERVPAHTSNPEGSKLHINKRSSSLSVPNPVSEKEVRTDMNEKMPAATHSRNLSASSAIDHDDEGNLKPARASLSRPGDFDMSPSLGGFSEMAADSAYEERPPLPEKDPAFARYPRSGELYDTTGNRHPRSDDESRPQLPPMNFGQSLEIKVEPPHRGPSPLGPLPLPPGEASKAANSDYRDTSRVARQGPSTRQPNASTSEDPAVMSQDAKSMRSSPSPEQKRLTRRRNIIKELVDTEHSFGQDMKVVDDIYKGTSTIIVISPDDTKTLFGNSDQIVAFSTNFLDALKQAARSIYVLSKSKRWKSNRVSNATTYSTTGDELSISGVELTDDEKDQKTFIGEAFGHHMAAMEKVYTEYLKNHDSANQRLAQLQKHSKVQIWLKECKAYAHDLTTAWDLDSLLVKPVQRILKYPLLLDQLLDVTPESHPDYTALKLAAKEMKTVSMRINDAKKRADILEQVSGNGRKRKDSDMRTGLAKAFGAGKKLRQQVGATGVFEDKDFNKLADKFSEHFVRLQIIMRDVEMYSNDVDQWMRKFLDFAVAIEALIDVGQTSYPELESKWRKFRMSMRDMSTMALPDHVDQIQKHVVLPMQTLVKLHEGPQRMMNKRNKRLPDYSRYLALKDRGDKADKKTAEQAEQFLALNDTLKDEVPKLFELTNKLMERCLGNFVQLQYKWLKLWKLKLKQAIDIPSATQDGELSAELLKVIKIYTQDFAFFEGQVASLAICNGALLNETPNLVQFASPITDPSGPNDSVLPPVPSRATPSFETKRTHSVSSEQSPVIPTPDFGDTRGNGGFFPIGDPTLPGQAPSRQSSSNVNRARAVSNVSNHTTTPQTPQVPGSWRTYSNVTTPINTTPSARHGLGPLRQVNDPSPSLRPSTDSSRAYRLSDDSALTRPSPGTSLASSTQIRTSSPSRSNDRFSGYFSSAMPMSDSPPIDSSAQDPARNVHVIFLAASVYEFNIDRARKEAGYPYLTYVAGEIFDVIGEKGELWLARNQDDRTRTVGWIWNKHFVKLAS